MIRELGAHADWVMAVAFAPDGRHAITGSRDGINWLLDLETDELDQPLSSDPMATNVAAVAIAADADPRPEVMRLAVPLAGDPRLIPGTNNRVEVQAYNADGSLRSRGAVVEYQAGGPVVVSTPELWAVVVGTADYIGTDIDLRYAAKDAEAFFQALAVAADRLLGKERVHIRTLSTDRPGTGDRPTKSNIEAAFKQIAAHARPTDLLVVYLSGHGVAPQGSDEYYYLTADVRSLELDDPAVRRRTRSRGPSSPS